MNEVVEESLKKITKGSSVFLFGTVIQKLISFVTIILIIRFLTVAEFGLFSIAIVIVGLFVLVAGLGLKEGVTRYIPYWRGKRDKEKIVSTIHSAVWIALVSSIVLSIILFVASEFISTSVYNLPELTNILRIIAIVIPFSVIFSILISIFRGFDQISPKFYFENITSKILYLAIISLFFFLGFTLIGVVYALIISMAISTVLFVMFAYKKIPPLIGKIQRRTPMTRELLYFSIPLLVYSILAVVIMSTDTLMLGYFRVARDVGLYNASLKIANLIPIPLAAFIFLYFPIASRLYSKNLIAELKRVYSIITKWSFSITIPALFIFLLFPGAILGILFGTEYSIAATVLQILVLGMFFHTLLGPNAATIVVLGKTKHLTIIFFFGVILNIILNYTLIPILGTNGAAIASAVSLIFINLSISLSVYNFLGVHPITKNYVKPIISSFIIFLFFIGLINLLNITATLLVIILFFVLFTIIYSATLVLTKSIDQEDIMLINALERKLGMNFALVKRVIGIVYKHE